MLVDGVGEERHDYEDQVYYETDNEIERLDGCCWMDLTIILVLLD